MAYPTNLDSFTTKGSGDTIVETHVNVLQTAIVSLEEKVGTGAPSSMSSATTNTALLGIGASASGYQVISLANTSLVTGTLGRANGGTGITTATTNTAGALVIPAGAVNAASGAVILDASAKLPAVDGSQLTNVVTGLTNSQVFTSSGTWTQPAGVVKVCVEAWGGGGGGGGGGFSARQGGGGGGGGYSKGIIAVTGNVTVTVGTGGAGSAGNADGIAGVSSTFAGTTTLTAGGGSGGAGNGATGGGAGGSGTITGQTGQAGTTSLDSGKGGASFGVSMILPNVVGAVPGAGGGGGLASGDQTGKAGGNGLVILTW